MVRNIVRGPSQNLAAFISGFFEPLSGLSLCHLRHDHHADEVIRHLKFNATGMRTSE